MPGRTTADSDRAFYGNRNEEFDQCVWLVMSSEANIEISIINMREVANV